ncbi:MAG TPA: POTRA domain-containing protein, partial [Devosia sp.]|nr:POTRA domain-containing protein [Devosia sp.]
MSGRQMGQRRRAGRITHFLVGAAVLPLFLALGGPARAQSSAIERNLPAAPVSTDAALALAASDAGSTDTTPLGVDVAGIALIGDAVAVQNHPPHGISLTALPVADRGRLEAVLAPLIGQPLSAALIAEAQAAVAAVWRASGYPFMSVTVPPQEVTGGVLTLRVVAFTAGSIVTDSASETA